MDTFDTVLFPEQIDELQFAACAAAIQAVRRRILMDGRGGGFLLSGNNFLSVGHVPAA